LRQRWRGDSGRPNPLPIDTAPIKPGEEFGPCLPWGPEVANYPQDTCWVIGRWNGEKWCDQEGPVFNPTHWSPLPRSGPLTEEQERKFRKIREEDAERLREDAA
jgi:hypothetical protein